MAKPAAKKTKPKSRASPQPTDPRFAAVLKAFAADPKLAPIVKAHEAAKQEGGRKFGADGLKVKEKIFAMMSSRGEFVVKLPKQRVDELVGAGVGTYFDPGHGRLMKQWLTVLSPRANWIELAKEAHAYGKSGP
jgi:hypothetical protein